MDCLGVDAVLAFVSGRLSDADDEEVHRHLGTCAECRALVAETAKAELPERPPAAARLPPAGQPEPSSSSPRTLAPGTTISRYVISRALGLGAEGVVYEAYDPQLKRKVALKLLVPHGGASTELLREAQSMARLSHPNVVNVYDAGIYGGEVFIVMELVPGVTLAEWLRRSPWSWRDIVQVMAGAGRGLAAAHAAGLVHRDFKPQNVLVADDGRVRVTDFGLARSTALPGTPPAASTALGSTVTAVAGTPAYMAPEQFLGARADTPSDQFSFCVVLFMAVHGRHPFGDTGPNLLRMTRDLASAELAAPSGQPRSLPLRLDEVLARGLKVKPGERHATMQAVVDALEEILAQGAPLPRRWRGRIVKGVIAAAIAALAGAGLFSWTTAPVCGNGRAEGQEECDDGNHSDSDGCLSDCRWARCGDGKLRAGVEECDDGNNVSGDGCSAHCLACGVGDASFAWDVTGACYSRHDRPAPWPVARQTCEALGGHLITYTSTAERAAVWARLLGGAKRPSWLGTLVDRAGRTTWITGEPMALGPMWAKGEPRIEAKTGADYCVHELPDDRVYPPEIVNPETWATGSCSEPRAFACESSPWTIRPVTNHAYRIYASPAAWIEARDACAAKGGHLVTITDANEQVFVNAQTSLGFWTGLSEGATKNTLAWTTGERFAFQAFAPGEPDEESSKGVCVVFGPGTVWYDRSCGQRNPFMCEID